MKGYFVCDKCLVKKPSRLAARNINRAAPHQICKMCFLMGGGKPHSLRGEDDEIQGVHSQQAPQ